MKPINKKALMIQRALKIRKLRASALKKKRRRRIRQVLDRFIVLATNLNNVPHETTGWTATLSRGTTIITALFDDFGVARFNTLTTLTTLSYVLRIRNADGDVIALRTIPADREFYVARFDL